MLWRIVEHPAVELKGITKRYPGVVANQNAELTVMPGEVHALVGENGAGKSTLMKVMYGMVQPDEGTVRIDGHQVKMKSPKDAIDSGIGMVHQHFMLADNLTVLENVVLGSEPTVGPQIDFRAARDRILEFDVVAGVTHFRKFDGIVFSGKLVRGAVRRGGDLRRRLREI